MNYYKLAFAFWVFMGKILNILIKVYMQQAAFPGNLKVYLYIVGI